MPRIPVPPHPPVLGSSGDTKSSGPLLVGIITHVENPMVIAAATETPRRERSHAVGVHVAEGHWVGGLLHNLLALSDRPAICVLGF
jgi:hypothetical protein